MKFTDNIIKHLAIVTLLLVTITGCSSIVPIDASLEWPNESSVRVSSATVEKFSGSRYSISGEIVANKIAQRITSEGFIEVNTYSPFVLTGQLNPSQLTYNTWTEPFKGNIEEKNNKDITHTYYVAATQSVTVNYTVMYQNKKLASGSKSFTYENEKSAHTSYVEAKAKLPSSAEIANTLNDDVAQYIAKQISPYTLHATLNFLLSDDSNIGTGISFVEQGKTEQAFSIFDHIITNNNSPGVQAVALHNQGLILLMQGDYDKAYSFVKKANMIDSKNKNIIASMKNVEKYKLINDAHLKQLNQ